MYESPRLVCFGSIPQITQAGCIGASDGVQVTDSDGNTGTAVGSDDPGPGQPYCYIFGS